ncbi:hypothetical protein D3C81_2291460 [compost metagenome]
MLALDVGQGRIAQLHHKLFPVVGRLEIQDQVLVRDFAAVQGNAKVLQPQFRAHPADHVRPGGFGR